ncbi:MAG: peptidylprolyl isomerase [Candidatus Limivicinus sp.]|jgi:hypothetical protein
MKKFLVIVLIICIIFTGVVSYLNYGMKESVIAANENAPAQSEEGTETEIPEEAKTLDYEKIYGLHEPDSVVMTVDGKDVKWSEYFYWLFLQSNQMENYFRQLAAYTGAQINWGDTAVEESGENFGDVVVNDAEKMLCQLYAIEKYAADNKIELKKEDEESIADDLKEALKVSCGEDATEEDFNKYLSEIYMERELYDRLNRAMYLNTRAYNTKYGRDAELVSDEDALKFLEDNDYMAASHILLMSIDPETREALAEDKIAEKKAQAGKLAEELAAIEDPEERAEKFAEMKAKYCEDSGKEAYPDGYIFTPGTMVAEFEEACKSLKENEVSGVVESDYGFHIILRQPLDADRAISYTREGTAQNARAMFANQEFNSAIIAVMDGLKVEYAPGFEHINLADYAA